jgi:hypothetical protein
MAEPFLDAELQELRDSHQAATSRLKTLRQISRGLTVLFVVTLVAFLAGFYFKVTNMYAPERFEEPLREEALNLLPRMETELLMLWEETAPVYGELALERFEEALPAIQNASQRELNALLSNLKTNAQERVDASLARLHARHHERINRHFPNLSTAEGAEERGMYWMETVESDFEHILGHFHDRYFEDLGHLEATLEQFRRNDFEQMSAEQLTRQFLHLWLMKVDRFILLADQGESLDRRKGPDHAS